MSVYPLTVIQHCETHYAVESGQIGVQYKSMTDTIHKTESSKAQDGMTRTDLISETEISVTGIGKQKADVINKAETVVITN